MKPNLNRVLMGALWSLFGLVLLLLIVVPLLTALIVKTGRVPLDFFKYLAYIETVQAYLMRGLGLAWIFFLGSCFASFLNVVAWRVPRGRGITGSSECPHCNTRLRFSDNLPIIGWIRNEGKCRSCRRPISPRYLIVEIVLGCIFLLIGSLEILAGGVNLPLREIERLRGFEHLLFTPKWELIQLSIYHLVLICFLFTFTLIRSERLKVPISIFLAALILGVGLPFVWPSMQLLSWQVGVTALVDIDRFSLDQILTIAMGVIGGIGCGMLIRWTHEDSDHSLVGGPQSDWVDDGLAGLILVGVFLGWQSTFSVTVILLGVSVIASVGRQLRLITDSNLSGQILVATLLHLVFWRMTTWFQLWPSPTTGGGMMTVWVFVLLVLAILVRLAIRPKLELNRQSN
jgi:leader peptidase (prepilin peptidase)/N-methyltransferase